MSKGMMLGEVRTRLLAAMTLVALLTASARAQFDAPTLAAAKDNLRRVAAQDPQANDILTGLRKTDDKALLPLLKAMGKSSDRLRRIFAVLAVSELAGAEADAWVREMLHADTDPAVQAAALRHLTDRKVATGEDISVGLKSSDEALSLLAARQAVKAGTKDQALPVLQKLTMSPTAEIADLARMVLLSAGDQAQAEALRRTISSPTAPLSSKLRLLNLAELDGIAAARPVIEGVLSADPPADQVLRTQALKSLAAITPSEGAEAIAAELGRTKDVFAQMQLMARLVELPDAAAHLEKLKESPDAMVAAAAKFELARSAGQREELIAQTKTLLSSGHPIVADFVLRRAETQSDPAYVAPLLEYIRAVPRESGAMGAEHQRAARATALLVKLNTPEATTGLAEILGGRYNGVTRAAATGLIVAEGPALPALCAILLDSPYDELVTDATLALARIGDARAAKGLTAILQHPDRHPPALVAMASWYALKLAGQAETFVTELAEQVVR